MKTKITIILFFCTVLTVQNAFSIELPLNESTSNVHYTLTCLSIPFKKKALPTTGKMDIEKISSTPLKYKLTKIDTLTYFTSKNKLFRKVIDYDKYPSFSFMSDIKTPILAVENEDFIVNGDLTFHGVTKKAQMKVMISIENNEVILHGEYAIKMTEFGLEPPSLFFAKVDDDIKTRLELQTE